VGAVTREVRGGAMTCSCARDSRVAWLVAGGRVPGLVGTAAPGGGMVDGNSGQLWLCAFSSVSGVRSFVAHSGL